MNTSVRKLIGWPGRILALALLLCLAGGTLSALLLGLHARGLASTGLLARVCGEGDGCDKVLASRWSVFPPRPADAPGESGADRSGAQRQNPSGIPVAALGLFWFTLAGAWLAVVGLPAPQLWWRHSLLLALAIASCLGSLAFIAIMKFAVGAWCPFCLGAHLANFTLLAALIAMRPRLAAPVRERPPRAPASRGPVTQPETRVALAAVCLGLALCATEWFAYRGAAAAARNLELEGLVQKYAMDSDLLAASYYRTPKREIPVREDDPIVPASPGVRMTLVCFSDADCPHCARFHQLLFKEIKPLFEGHLRIVFKHYPMGGMCNPHVTQNLHPSACAAASALEAARLQKGSQGFYALLDRLLPLQGRLASADYAALAGELGMDVPQFRHDLQSAVVKQRISDDITLAHSLKVTGTPAVFLNGRPVDRLSRDLLGFWKVVAKPFQGRNSPDPAID